MIVTPDNIDSARESIASTQLAEALQIGGETWPIYYSGGQRGDMLLLPDGRCGVDLGGDPTWGDWCGDHMLADDTDQDGNPVWIDAAGQEVER